MINYKTNTLINTRKSQQDILSGWDHRSPPLASICCITYNHASYIQEAIDSFLMQETNFPFEILVHDDASTDGTTKIVLDYAQKYPEIIKPIIQTENQYTKGGLINPRFVFPKTRGKYIALCEGDDYWTDNKKLQKQVAFLERNPGYVITYTNGQAFDENGNLDVDFGASTRDLDAEELIKARSLHTLTTCFRNVIKEIPLDLLSARYGDLIMWSLLGAHGKGKYLADIKPAAYRIHDGGVHSKKTRKQQDEMALITSNALLSYYTRLGDIDTARYFLNKSFRLSRKIIGWKGIIALRSQTFIKKINTARRLVTDKLQSWNQ